MEPLITCILTSHRKPEFCREAIESVLAQTWPHKQLIVMDSGDLAAAGYFMEWDDLRWYVTGWTEAQRAAGWEQGYAINECFRRGLVQGDLVTYLCDDDVYALDAFEVFANAAMNEPLHSAWYGSADVCEWNGPNDWKHLYRLRAKELRTASNLPRGHVDGMQVCHRRGVYAEWPEDRESGRESDGIFLNRLAEQTPLHPLLILVGQHRRTPLSTWTKSSRAS